MPERVRICSAEQLPAEGHAKEFFAGEVPVCVSHIGGKLGAIHNICPHRGGPLAEGMIENGKIACPWHAWEFDPATGECSTVPGSRVDAYSIQVQGDDVFLEI